MRSIWPHVQRFRYVYSCWQFFSAHGWIVEPLEMNHEDFRKSKYRYIFLHVINSLAFLTFVPASFHNFWCHVWIQTVKYIYISGVSNSTSGNTDAEIHEVIKSQTLVMAILAFNLTAKLPLKQVSNYRIIPCTKIFSPLLTLFVHRQLITIEFLILWLSLYSI